MKLEKLLRNVPVTTCTAARELEITGVCYDSRQVRPGDLFVAVPGFAADGHRFIPMALEHGAAAVLCEKAAGRRRLYRRHRRRGRRWRRSLPTGLAIRRSGMKLHRRHWDKRQDDGDNGL